MQLPGGTRKGAKVVPSAIFGGSRPYLKYASRRQMRHDSDSHELPSSARGAAL